MRPLRKPSTMLPQGTILSCRPTRSVWLARNDQQSPLRVARLRPESSGMRWPRRIIKRHQDRDAPQTETRQPQEGGRPRAFHGGAVACAAQTSGSTLVRRSPSRCRLGPGKGRLRQHMVRQPPHQGKGVQAFSEVVALRGKAVGVRRRRTRALPFEFSVVGDPSGTGGPTGEDHTTSHGLVTRHTVRTAFAQWGWTRQSSGH